MDKLDKEKKLTVLETNNPSAQVYRQFMTERRETKDEVDK